MYNSLSLISNNQPMGKLSIGPDRLESIIFDITVKKIENLPSRLIIGSSL